MGGEVGANCAVQKLHPAYHGIAWHGACKHHTHHASLTSMHNGAGVEVLQPPSHVQQAQQHRRLLHGGALEGAE